MPNSWEHHNGDIFVLFETYEEFKPLLQTKTKAYKVANIEEFAKSLLKDIIDLHEGKVLWDRLDDAFIFRLKLFHKRISPLFLRSLHSVLSYDEQFNEGFVSWSKEQGFDINKVSNEVEENVKVDLSQQAAYILINQLLFYKILENSNVYYRHIPKLKACR